MAHGGGATSNRRGGYGALSRGSRGHGKDKAVKKAEQRERDPRWQKAKEETEAARLALEAIIEEQKQSPALGATAGALIAARQKKAQEILYLRETAQEKIEAEIETAASSKPPPKKQFFDPEPIMSESGLPMRQPLWKFEKNFDPTKLPQQGDGNQDFAVTSAIKKLKMGYHVSIVLKEFGIGVTDIPDGLFDELGWGIRSDSKESSNGTES